MKKLSKINLKRLDAEVLSEKEMKEIHGAGVTEDCPTGSFCGGSCMAYIGTIPARGNCVDMEVSGTTVCACRIYG